MALSDDGNTLAVGARGESSNATGSNGDQTNDWATDAGAVYVLVRDGMDTWSQQAYLKASTVDVDDIFGYSVALSGDGNILAVGAFGEDGNAPGIGGDESDDSVGTSGAVYVLVRDDAGAWTQRAYVKASNPREEAFFGRSVALSEAGDVLAAAATLEASNATGIGGDQTNDAAIGAGAVYLY